MRLDVTGHTPDREPPSQTWRDGGMPLENQVTEMVVGILLHAEREAREFLLWRHKSDIEDRARKEREARLAAERAEAERIAREAAVAKARIQALVDGADALEKAERIRRYVAAVTMRMAGKEDGPAAAAVERWAEWALAEAASIDPVETGRFAQDLAAHGR